VTSCWGGQTQPPQLLKCLKQLSLYLQSNAATVVNVSSHVDDAKLKLLALKQENGATLSKFLSSYECDQHYKGVEIVKKDSDQTQFLSLRSQFFQSLYDNLQQRFPAADFLESANCLNPSAWPRDPLQRALFGEKNVAKLCKDFCINNADAADVVLQYSMFKNSDGLEVGQKLKNLVKLLEVLPVSSADCERGFSQMNLYHTSGRNRLLVSSVNDLLMLGINGPPLAFWNAEKYVISWLKAGRHGALDKATGLPKKIEEVKHSSTLFL